jgi:hypothetical protein
MVCFMPYVDVVREVPEAIKISTTVEPVQPQVMEQNRPNRHVDRLRPNVETPPKFGGVLFSAQGISRRAAASSDPAAR